MVLLHSDFILKEQLWTHSGWTMTWASQGPDVTITVSIEEKRRVFIMLKSVKYFDMSHTPWCCSSCAFPFWSGTIDFLLDQVASLPASKQTFQEEPWPDGAAIQLGHFPWPPLTSLWGSHVSCGASQVPFQKLDMTHQTPFFVSESSFFLSFFVNDLNTISHCPLFFSLLRYTFMCTHSPLENRLELLSCFVVIDDGIVEQGEFHLHKKHKISKVVPPL